MINDTGDKLYGRLLADQFPEFDLIVSHSRRKGLAGAVQSAWEQVQDMDFIFHLEEDFVLQREVDIPAMVDVLHHRSNLAQLVLKRQPVNEMEHAAGGIIEQFPREYHDLSWDGHPYVQHQRIFSLNPTLIPHDVFALGWPHGNEAEMTQILLSKGFSFAFWGNRADPPACLHIGAERTPAWTP